MRERWVKLYASTLSDAVFTDRDSDTLKVWIWILLTVFYKPNTVFIGNQQVELLPGQMTFGRRAAGLKLDMPESKVYRIVKKLAKKGCITIESTNKFSIITVNNWAEYQQGDGVDKNVDKKIFNMGWGENGVFLPDSEITEDEQQMNTIKKEKNIKNEYNISSSHTPAREEDPEKIPRVMGGTLGRNVLVLSDEQFGNLLDIMPLETFHHYCNKLTDFMINKKRSVSNHYELIKKWFYEDFKGGISDEH